MNAWMNWLVIAGVMVILEIFSGTFYLLMIALGMLAAALVAFWGWSVNFQVITAALVGAVATILLRRSRFGAVHLGQASRDPNVNMDIGQTIQVNEWHTTSPGVYTARAMYRGALWNVEYAIRGESTLPQPGVYKIVEIQGSQLMVERIIDVL